MRSSLSISSFTLYFAALCALLQLVSAGKADSKPSTPKTTSKGGTSSSSSNPNTAPFQVNSPNDLTMATTSSVPSSVIALIAKLATDPGVNGGYSVVDPIKNQSSMVPANALFEFGTTTGSLEFWYLQWARSYSAGQQISFLMILNKGQTAPTSITSIILYDHYGKTNLATIAQNVALPSGVQPQTPFTLGQPWTIPSTLSAQFEFDGWFKIVMTYTNAKGQTETKDRLVNIQGLTASPGGAANSVFQNAVGMSKYGAVDFQNLLSINKLENSTTSAAGPSNTTDSTKTSSADRVHLSTHFTIPILIASFIGLVISNINL